MSREAPAADTKYTQQLALDVGDIPGHQVATSSRDECLIVREGLEGKPVPDGCRMAGAARRRSRYEQVPRAIADEGLAYSAAVCNFSACNSPPIRPFKAPYTIWCCCTRLLPLNAELTTVAE
jgi:hypothetical protein